MFHVQRSLLRILLALLVCGVLGPIAATADTTGAPVAVSRTEGSGPKLLSDYNLPGLDAKVKLDTIDQWDVVQLIEFLAYKGGLNNIVIGKGVAGLTTKLKFQDVTVGDALEIVLSVNSLAYEVKNGIITITTDAEYTAIHGQSFYDEKKVRSVDLKYADAAHVASMLAPIVGTGGKVISDAVTGTLILIDTEKNIREMMAIIAKADIATVSRVLPTVTRTFQLQYADVESIQSEIAALITAAAGSIHANTRTKTLIVTELPHTMAKIESLVATFDRPRKQVFIEAKILEVSLNDDYKLGISWDHLFEGLDPRMSLSSAVTRPAAVGAGSGVGQLTYKTIVGGANLNVVLDALKTVGETKILSNPHVAVMSDESATIKVVRDQPYSQAQLESGTTNVVGETIQFIEVGVKLEVTPRINDSGYIRMAIKPEVSTVVDEYQAFRLVPVVQRSFAETHVMVKDSETIIISGMIRNEKQKGEARVPILGRIPIFGVLFRSNSDSLLTSETVTFLTPRIVTGDRPYRLIRDEEKQPKGLRGVAAKP